MSGLWADPALQARLRRDRLRQGLPETLEDPLLLRRLALRFLAAERGDRPGPSRSRVASRMAPRPHRDRVGAPPAASE